MAKMFGREFESRQLHSYTSDTIMLQCIDAVYTFLRSTLTSIIFLLWIYNNDRNKHGSLNLLSHLNMRKTELLRTWHFLCFY